MDRLRRPLAALLLGLSFAALFVATTASAADPLAEAKRHFTQGVNLYNDGNYNAALAEFEAANTLHHSPGFLYNVGLTQKALFRYNEAILSLQHYLDEEKKMAPEKRAEVKTLIIEMRALLADVTIDVAPDGATIALDGRTIGKSPFDRPYGIAAGSHVLDITLEGYAIFHKELMVTAGTPIRIDARLVLIPKTGKVHIVATRPNSTVKIDDKLVGVAPVDIELGLGGHTLEVESKGYQLFRSELVVAAGQERTFTAELELPPAGKGKWYTKWYVWVPVSVVIAGGVAVGLGVGLTQKPAPIGGTLGTSTVN